ncbi:MAG TPA: imidazole glycerol phosphate synthase subunit HisH [Candidatus Omnitrophica bacterium]|nr:MAG: imidazole glycerol phosphate synthase, glutamine amidotransferase subunit [Omnitrophica WOR_2 bacterium GWF2_63_9]OGX33169.1 MAG: imidazole glycerol phosphate synthase, glutamine amidotransferase subunit [Omnitrophica WOR_2 bacterium RIFCSPHIGHO2_12_FULL_64_13]OGX36072.1 MAG: imidazole glycerol phosphate synthase, glutamine amidotransferase subunit [Omnitrophica WOR_2 bacterium RIFCSPHIGHO2_02_FULL_63_39]OGX44113.1 MAG: imidazole glycerol phosphate synthase, glutamine amidotransferase su
MIAVIDYGMGNLRSVSKALEHVGAAVQVTSDPHTLERAEKIILPGVGAFPSAMRELRARKLVDPIKEAIAVGKPYLGICLGLQLLFERSEEGEGVEGLGIVPGVVRRFQAPPARRAHWPGRASLKRQAALKIPHMGWNQVNGDKRQATSDKRCPLLQGIPEGSYVYFVHSYYADPVDRGVVVLETEYGIRFASMVWKDNLFATQFHPEKSQAVGLTLLKNFVER